MIVPVIEERLVVTKQLYLVEELHIHQRLTGRILDYRSVGLQGGEASL